MSGGQLHPLVEEAFSRSQAGDRAAPVGRTVGQLAIKYVSDRFARKEIGKESARTYRDELVRFARFVGPDRAISGIRRSTIEDYLGSTDVAARTVRDRVTLLQQFFRWAKDSGYTRSDPAKEIPKPREPRRLPRGLKTDQVAAALSSCPDARSRLIVTLMVQEGLRRGEVARLQLADIDTDERTLLVTGKGGHERVLPISDETWLAIQAYLSDHPAKRGPLLRSYVRPSCALSPSRIGIMVSEILHEAGVQASGHALRHTMAGDLLRRGVSLRDIQTALGHVNLGTTQRYLPLTAGSDLREAMSGRQYRHA